MLEGVPGSGKSYYAVSERLLKWVRAGRRVYVFVDGFYLDRLALFEGVDLAELEQQITLWHVRGRREGRTAACGAWVRGVDRRSANRVSLERQDGP